MSVPILILYGWPSSGLLSPAFHIRVSRSSLRISARNFSSGCVSKWFPRLVDGLVGSKMRSSVLKSWRSSLSVR